MPLEIVKREAVVVISHTIMDGLVARWYRSLDDAERVEPLLSASRNGAMIHGTVYLHDLPDEWMAAAREAHAALKANRREDVMALATHRYAGFATSDLEPIVKPEASL